MVLRMPNTIRKTATTIVALGALALGGSALANAATSNSTTANSGTPSAAAGQPPSGGRHVGANGKTEQPLNAADTAKVKAAALKKLPGATIERVETNVDGGGVYEAHVTKSDGSQATVLLDQDFSVTSVQAGPQHP
jgi:uncharacterized membrane protein YkoI